MSREKLAKKWLVVGMGLTFAARLGTQIYYLASMPRTPHLLSGRTFPTGAAFNTLVYVTKTELDWTNFIDYYMITGVGVGVVLFAIFAIIPAARRSGEL